jgi:hypothetical protein
MARQRRYCSPSRGETPNNASGLWANHAPIATRFDGAAETLKDFLPDVAEALKVCLKPNNAKLAEVGRHPWSCDETMRKIQKVSVIGSNIAKQRCDHHVRELHKVRDAHNTIAHGRKMLYRVSHLQEFSSLTGNVQAHRIRP